jgi:hypothetical protein
VRTAAHRGLLLGPDFVAVEQSVAKSQCSVRAGGIFELRESDFGRLEHVLPRQFVLNEGKEPSLLADHSAGKDHALELRVEHQYVTGSLRDGTAIALPLLDCDVLDSAVAWADVVSAAVALQAVEPAAATDAGLNHTLDAPGLDVPGLHLVSEGQAAAPVEAAPADAGSPDHLQEVLVPAMAVERICHSCRLGVVAENDRTAVKAHPEATDETLPNPVNQVAGADDERTVPVDLAGHSDRDRSRFGVDLVDELEEFLEILLEGALEATRISFLVDLFDFERLAVHPVRGVGALVPCHSAVSAAKIDGDVK